MARYAMLTLFTLGCEADGAQPSTLAQRPEPIARITPHPAAPSPTVETMAQKEMTVTICFFPSEGSPIRTNGFSMALAAGDAATTHVPLMSTDPGSVPNCGNATLQVRQEETYFRLFTISLEADQSRSPSPENGEMRIYTTGTEYILPQWNEYGYGFALAAR